jgi:transcriptional regulator with XRE-family HTH domain
MAHIAPNEGSEPIRLDYTKMRRRRRMLDLSQAAIAQRAGVHRNAISYWERGRRGPTHLEFARVARILGSRPEDLFDVVDINGNTVSEPWRGKK